MKTSQAQLTRKALFLGDSYISFNNLPQLTAQVASSAGDNLLYDSYTPGGYKLIEHVSNPTSNAKIMAGGWDYVVLQDQSQTPALENGNFPTGARNLCYLIKQYNPCAQPLFCLTWGRENGDALNCPIFPAMCTYRGMDSLLTLNYTAQADFSNAEVSPVGAVWKYLRQNYPSLDLYEPDGSHPTQAGSYVAACCFYTAIFKKDPQLITYNYVLNAVDAAVVKNAVKAVFYSNLSAWNFKRNPSSDFNYSVGFGTNELIFKFKPTYPGGGPYSHQFFWDFGDGSTLAQLNPGIGTSVPHSYAANGTYTVTLTVSDCDPSGTQQSVTQHTISFCNHTPSIYKTFPWRCLPDTFSTEVYDAYQWYSQNEPLAGETNQRIGIAGVSDLSVLTTLNGCTEMSPSFFVDNSPGILSYDLMAEGHMVDTNTACIGNQVLLIAAGLLGQESITWSLNGTAIPNALNDTLVVTSPGIYKLTLFHDNCPASTTFSKQLSLAFVDCTALGIPAGRGGLSADVYPNPTSGFLKVSGPEKISSVDVYDFLGRKLQSKTYEGDGSMLLDLSGEAAGMYFLKINGGQRYAPVKVVRY